MHSASKPVIALIKSQIERQRKEAKEDGREMG